MKKLSSALISVFYKDGLEAIVQQLHEHNVVIYSTGGTQQFIEALGIPCVAAETITGFPSILGGRVKTLHPKIFGGILGVRQNAEHAAQMQEHNIPAIDMVVVDLYPFEETVKNHIGDNEQPIIEKIDIGGPSMLRAAAKNFADVVVVGSKDDYQYVSEMLRDQQASTSLEQRRALAIKAFDVCTAYDHAISNYFHNTAFTTTFLQPQSVLRYGENPHQSAAFYGNTGKIFSQLHGKALSYNNLVDADAAFKLMQDLTDNLAAEQVFFAIIKHTNVCGAAARATVHDAWQAALAGDPESAFGGILITNAVVDEATAQAISEIFFEVLIAPAYEPIALEILQKKKNRILLQQVAGLPKTPDQKNLLNGILVQQADEGNVLEEKEVAGVTINLQQKNDLMFANIICKHLKSNAIALVKNMQLLGKGCGQTSRVDALRQAIEKANQFEANLQGAALASDAFFPFDDCVKLAHAAGINSFIQPGGSMRDEDSIQYCRDNKLAMLITGMRHFRH